MCCVTPTLRCSRPAGGADGGDCPPARSCRHPHDREALCASRAQLCRRHDPGEFSAYSATTSFLSIHAQCLVANRLTGPRPRGVTSEQSVMSGAWNQKRPVNPNEPEDDRSRLFWFGLRFHWRNVGPAFLFLSVINTFAKLGSPAQTVSASASLRMSSVISNPRAR
jgi:hypothetical protein